MPRTRARAAARVLAALVSLAVVAGGCGGAAGGGGTEQLTVFAASSLTEVLTKLAAVFEADHPGIEVRLNFAASSTLARQIHSGGQADVLIVADHHSMESVTAAGEARNPRVVARSRMMLLVEPGNPKVIRSLAEVAQGDIVFVVCAPEVPCGRLAARLLAHAGLGDLRPVSLEANVKAVVAKVTLGEADAGLVYATDVKAAGDDGEGIEVEGADDPALHAVYWAAVVRDSAQGDTARAFLGLIDTQRGRDLFAGAGFSPP